MMHSHTFTYADEADLVQQLDNMLQKLTSQTMEDYADVRKRYGFENAAPAFSMRLKRFQTRGGTFPCERGRKGEKILRLAVTPALHAALIK